MAVEFHRHSGIDAPKVRFNDLETVSVALKRIADSTPQGAISDPTDGATVDAECRAAVDDILTVLRNLSLIDS